VERGDEKQLFFKYTEKKISDGVTFDGQIGKEEKQQEVALRPLNPKKRRRTVYEYTPCEELLTADWVEWINMLI